MKNIIIKNYEDFIEGRINYCPYSSTVQLATLQLDKTRWTKSWFTFFNLNLYSEYDWFPIPYQTYWRFC